MDTVEVTMEIAADATKVWELLADFGAFLKWAGGGQGEIEIEGEGIGMIRHLDLPGTGKLGERLTQCDAGSQTLAYELAYGNPLGMVRYQAEARVGPSESGARLYWIGRFETAQADQRESIAIALENAYTGMTQALEARVNSS